MLCVVTGGSALRLSANIRRLSNTLSSSESSTSGDGSVLCSLDVEIRCRDQAGTESKTNIPVRPNGVLEQSRTNPVLYFRNRIPELLCDGLALESVDSIRVRSSRHDDERDDGHLRSRLLETVVEAYNSVRRFATRR